MWGRQTKASVMRSIKLRRLKTTALPFLKEKGKQVLSMSRVGLLKLAQFCGTKAKELQINCLQSQRHDKLREIGERVYQLYRSNQLNWDGVISLCEEVKTLEAKMAERKSDQRAETRDQ